MGRDDVTAVILAGGRGTRLQTVVGDVPKPMAPIGGRPFLEFLLKHLISGGVTTIILSVGYKREVIIEHFADNYHGVPIEYAIENTPLGTGGAMKAALRGHARGDVFVINGDTFFDVDLTEVINVHKEQCADITIALKEMHNFDRYGAVELYAGRITAMHEKKHTARGYINGGIYCIKPGIFEGLPDKFSFEQFLSDNVDNLKICGVPSEGNFIDIGVPEDYNAAQTLIPRWIPL